MKKIAIMFAAAAMVVACGKKAPEVVLDRADSTTVLEQTVQAWNEKAAPAEVTDEAVAEAAATLATENLDSVKADLEAKALEAWKQANPADTNNVAFNDLYKANLAAALDAKVKAAAEKKEGEQKEGEQK